MFLLVPAYPGCPGSKAVKRSLLLLLLLFISPENILFFNYPLYVGWLGSRVVSVLDSGTVGPEFKLQPRRCRVIVLGKLFTPILPLFTKQ